MAEERSLLFSTRFTTERQEALDPHGIHTGRLPWVVAPEPPCPWSRRRYERGELIPPPTPTAPSPTSSDQHLQLHIPPDKNIPKED